MTTILVVDDHTLVRQSLVKALGAEPGFKVVGEVGRGDEVVDAVARHTPDIVLLDVSLPGEGGLEVAAQLRKLSPDVKIVFLTMHEDDATIRGFLDVDAQGFVPKTASTDELVRAMHTVAGGKSFLSPSVAKRVMTLAGGRDERHAGLSAREVEIMRLMAHGSSVAEIAGRLFVSAKTVKNHLTGIYAKLGVGSAAQAVAEAYRRGVVVPPAR